MTKRARRIYTQDFKLQMVQLYQSGKSANSIAREYDLTGSVLHNWIKQYGNSKSFAAKDNLTEDQKLLKLQEKELKQLRMENDILKQAALIMGRK